MFIPDPDFYRPLSRYWIPDPTPTKKKMEKINQLSELLFVGIIITKMYDHLFFEQVQKIFESINREFKYLTQQFLHFIYIFSL
jgi:hypothetical protein